MKREFFPKQGQSIKVVCQNGHTLAVLPDDAGDDDGEVVEIKCHRCRHYVYVMIDWFKRRVKVRNGSLQP